MRFPRPKRCPTSRPGTNWPRWSSGSKAGGLTLEQSLELWERGERLAAVCEEWLDGARARLAAAMAKRDEGEASAAADDAPF